MSHPGAKRRGVGWEGMDYPSVKCSRTAKAGLECSIVKTSLMAVKLQEENLMAKLEELLPR